MSTGVWAWAQAQARVREHECRVGHVSTGAGRAREHGCGTRGGWLDGWLAALVRWLAGLGDVHHLGCWIACVYMLDWGIKDSLTPSTSPVFYSQIGRRRPSNMASEPRSCVQTPSATYFPLRVIPPSLARSPYGGSLLTTYMAMLDRGIKNPLAPSISPEFYSRTC
jgi:hypothetical protein